MLHAHSTCLIQNLLGVAFRENIFRKPIKYAVFIREMTEVVRELNKLFDQLIKLTWKISSLAGVILFIIYSIKQ